MEGWQAKRENGEGFDEYAGKFFIELNFRYALQFGVSDFIFPSKLDTNLTGF
jgi:hypothetical protein